MSMTRFFTTYLYTPMAFRRAREAAVKRHGRLRRWLFAGALPVFWTFVVAGIWHGAGWTFVVFGLIHGLALAVNHGWREARMASPPPVLGWLLTMAVVVTGLVFFRAADVPTALALLAGMLGLSTPDIVQAAAHPDLVRIAADAGTALAWIAVLGTIVLTCPNTQELMGRHWFSSDPRPEGLRPWPLWLTWRPTLGWSVVGAILLAAALGSITGHSGFLYYQF
jgi:D-alanyl-lipoteichoic acid acyltransferase DltB (MBOAT superfamily)